jgi:hypothetical protein
LANLRVTPGKCRTVFIFKLRQQIAVLHVKVIVSHSYVSARRHLHGVRPFRAVFRSLQMPPVIAFHALSLIRSEQRSENIIT